MLRTRTVIAVVAIAALGAGGCAGAGEGDDATPPAAGATEASATPAAPTAEVTIDTFVFDPTPLEVEIGTTVTWTNEDKILHTATSGTPDAPSAVFDIEMAEVGTSGSFTFDEAGTYDYFCSRHATMRGQIVVS